jgi:hypothetical protein
MVTAERQCPASREMIPRLKWQNEVRFDAQPPLARPNNVHPNVRLAAPPVLEFIMSTNTPPCLSKSIRPNTGTPLCLSFISAMPPKRRTTTRRTLKAVAEIQIESDLKSPEIPKSPSPSPATRKRETSRELTPQPKRQRVTRSKSTQESPKAVIERAYQKPGEEGRKEILEIHRCLKQHEIKLPELRTLLDEEREMESQDPKTFEEAIERIKEEMKCTFEVLDEDGIWSRFLAMDTSPQAPNHIGKLFEDRRGRWLERWIEAPNEDEPRAQSEWAKLIGFVGEYLVHLHFPSVLIHQVFNIFKSLIPGFDETAWTSRYRAHVFPDLPTPKDRDHSSDFTFEDKDGVLGSLLKLPSHPDRTFYMEVKASREIENTLRLTPAQFRTVFIPDPPFREALMK